MPRHEARILRSAWEDIAGIADYLLRRAGRHIAEEMTGAILDAIDLLGTMPYMGSLHHDEVLQRLGYRKLVVKGYVCVYRVVDDVPTVYRVFHGAMDYPRRIDFRV